MISHKYYTVSWLESIRFRILTKPRYPDRGSRSEHKKPREPPFARQQLISTLETLTRTPPIRDRSTFNFSRYFAQKRSRPLNLSRERHVRLNDIESAIVCHDKASPYGSLSNAWNGISALTYSDKLKSILKSNLNGTCALM